MLCIWTLRLQCARSICTEECAGSQRSVCGLLQQPAPTCQAVKTRSSPELDGASLQQPACCCDALTPSELDD